MLSQTQQNKLENLKISVCLVNKFLPNKILLKFYCENVYKKNFRAFIIHLVNLKLFQICALLFTFQISIFRKRKLFAGGPPASALYSHKTISYTPVQYQTAQPDISFSQDKVSRKNTKLFIQSRTDFFSSFYGTKREVASK